MSRKTIFTVIALAAMLLAGGCFEKVPFTVTNELGSYDIHIVYISRSSDDVWGTNRLPGTDVLAPGRTAEVMVTPGTYDIQVTDEDGDTYTLNDVSIGSEGFDWTVTIEQIDAAAAPQPMNTGSCPVIIKNDLGSWDITGVWISDTYSDSWATTTYRERYSIPATPTPPTSARHLRHLSGG